MVSVKFLSNADVPPFQLTCFDDPVQKSMPFEIAIFSPNFENVFGFQGAIKVRDAQLVKTRKVSLTAMDFNNEGFASRFIWVDPAATSQSYTIDDTLWTLTITPNRNGSVSDFISIGDDVLASEATLGDFNNTKIDLVFKFIKRVTAVADATESIPFSMYPNPTGGSHVMLESEGNEIQSVIVYDLSGKVISQLLEVENDRCSLTTSEWLDGIYQMVVSTASGLVTRRLVVAR